MVRELNTEYVLSLSYGKDSLACLEAIKQLGYPLDRIVHAEVWATDTIPADLPPMVEFKKKADQQILDRYGITVEHICASRAVERERERERERELPTRSCSTGCLQPENILEPSRVSHSSEEGGVSISRQVTRLTYEDIFYRPTKKSGGGLWIPNAQGELVYRPQITGFATKWSQYCTGQLKRTAISMASQDSPRWAELNGVRENSKSTESTPRQRGFPKAPGHKAQL